MSVIKSTFKTVYRIYSRTQHEVNTDPQRRCYNGCHAKSEWVWTDWGHLGTVYTPEEAEQSVNGWGAVNKGLRREYKWVAALQGSNTELTEEKAKEL